MNNPVIVHFSVQKGDVVWNHYIQNGQWHIDYWVWDELVESWVLDETLS